MMDIPIVSEAVREYYEYANLAGKKESYEDCLSVIREWLAKPLSEEQHKVLQAVSADITVRFLLP